MDTNESIEAVASRLRLDVREIVTVETKLRRLMDAYFRGDDHDDGARSAPVSMEFVALPPTVHAPAHVDPVLRETEVPSAQTNAAPAEAILRCVAQRGDVSLRELDDAGLCPSREQAITQLMALVDEGRLVCFDMTPFRYALASPGGEVNGTETSRATNSNQAA